MPERVSALERLADAWGVAPRYVDGRGRPVEVGTETLLRVCAALGAPVAVAADAEAALAHRIDQQAAEVLPPVVVAWDGRLDTPIRSAEPVEDIELALEDGTVLVPETDGGSVGLSAALPAGYHRLRAAVGARTVTSTVISAPVTAWRRPGVLRRWGVGAQLAALWTERSRSMGDLHDLGTLCDWIGRVGGSFVNLLPLLPTFNDAPPEPSPYSPVSRLLWNELALDLGDTNVPVARPELLDVTRAAAEVRAGLAHLPESADGPTTEVDRYAAFRGAQRRLGRDWTSWPKRQRDGALGPADIDPDEERFHRTAQLEMQRQLGQLRDDLHQSGVELGLDLTVGVHPDGYDAWSRAGIFAHGMSVGAPPDAGFPSGQGWGFPPVHPERSRAEGHAYFAASVAHQAAVADVLRVDHIMAMQRLYWIPDGMGLADGTYVNYPLEEMFAVLCLESHRNECEIIGENLGTVAPEINAALERHDIRGMYLAEFEASAITSVPDTSTSSTAKASLRPTPKLAGPSETEVAMIDTHDTPLFAGWLDGVDIGERVELGLLTPDAAVTERDFRAQAGATLAAALGASGPDPDGLLELLLVALGESVSPLLVIWLEDLWLERRPVNIPGSGSADRPNWARPLDRSLEAAMADPEIAARLASLAAARSGGAS